MKAIRKIECVADGFGLVGFLAAMVWIIFGSVEFTLISNIALGIGIVCLVIVLTLWFVCAYLTDLLKKYNSRNFR